MARGGKSSNLSKVWEDFGFMEPRRNVIYKHPLISLDLSVIGCQEAFR
jgi:hypothetical protein